MQSLEGVRFLHGRPHRTRHLETFRALVLEQEFWYPVLQKKGSNYWTVRFRHYFLSTCTWRVFNTVTRSSWASCCWLPSNMGLSLPTAWKRFDWILMWCLLYCSSLIRIVQQHFANNFINPSQFTCRNELGAIGSLGTLPPFAAEEEFCVDPEASGSPSVQDMFRKRSCNWSTTSWTSSVSASGTRRRWQRSGH